MNKFQKALIAVGLPLVVATGCAGTQKKADLGQKPVEKQVVYQQLPTRSTAEQEVFSKLQSDLIYTLGDHVYQQNVTTGAKIDLTEGIRKTFGSVVNNPRVFPGLEDIVYFIGNDGGLYSYSKDGAHLIAADIRPQEYSIHGAIKNENGKNKKGTKADNKGDGYVYFIQTDKTIGAIKKLKLDGSNLEGITEFSLWTPKDLAVSPDNNKFICKLVPRSHNSSSLFSTPDYIVIDANTKRYQRMNFKEPFGKYNSESGPGIVAWKDNENILFTFKFPSEKQNVLYAAKIENGALNDIKQVTFDREFISSIRPLQNGKVLYVSDKSGTPTLYLLDGAVSTKIADSFHGENPYLAEIQNNQSIKKEDAKKEK